MNIFLRVVEVIFGENSFKKRHRPYYSNVVT